MSRTRTPRSPRRTFVAVALRWGILLAVLACILWVSGCMERLFYYPTSGPTPPPEDFPQAESVWFRSADGTRLHGWFIPTVIGRPGEVPTILHAHGNAGNIQSHLAFTQFLPLRGFNLLIFDYRGYGQSDGAARRRDDLIADTAAALDSLLARDDVDPDRIGLYGQSLGGGIGLNVMARRPELRAAIIVSAFTSWRDIAANAVGGRDPGPIARGLAAICIEDHCRPIDAIARIDRPILLLHGDADRTVPVTHGRALAKAASSATYVELAGGDHNDLPSGQTEQTVVAFFRRSLAHPAGPAEPMGEKDTP